MKPENLLNIGFTANEAKIYLALLENPKSCASYLSKQTKVHRTNVYDILQRLLDKGMVVSFSGPKKMYFTAKDPSYLVKMLELKKKMLQSNF